MNYHVISIFPDTIDSYVNESIIGRGIKNSILNIYKYPLREYTFDKHKRVDGIAYGGGPGMVLWIDPIVNASKDIIKSLIKENKNIEKIKSKIKNKISKETSVEKKKILKQDLLKVKKQKVLIVNFNIGGQKFDTDFAKSCIQKEKYTDIVFICGRYEGVDDRVNVVISEMYKFYKINFDIINMSIGDYVLTGGELPAMIMIDSISRQIEGVLHDKQSLEEDRISSRKVYARPEIYELDLKDKISSSKDKNIDIKDTVKSKPKYRQKKIVARVPEVLLSGNHAKIDEWRKLNS